MTKRSHVKLIILMLLGMFMGSGMTQAQDANPEHLLDGLSFDYYYQNGSGLSVDFQNGKVSYEWITGPRVGNKGEDIAYDSRKIGDQMYMIYFHEKHKPDFVTLIFNFEQNVMYSSAILRYGTEKEMIVFSGGIIEHVNR